MVVKVTHRVNPTLLVRDAKLDQTYDFGDIRRTASTEWQTDYLIDVCPCDNIAPGDLHSHKLALLAGNNRQVSLLTWAPPLFSRVFFFGLIFML